MKKERKESNLLTKTAKVAIVGSVIACSLAAMAVKLGYKSTEKLFKFTKEDEPEENECEMTAVEETAVEVVEAEAAETESEEIEATAASVIEAEEIVVEEDATE